MSIATSMRAPLVIDAPPGQAARLQQLLLQDSDVTALCVLWHEPPRLDARTRVRERRRDGADEALVVLVPDGDPALRRDLLANGADEVIPQAGFDSAVLAACADARARVRARMAATLPGSAEVRFRALVEQAAGAYFLHDGEGRFLDVNVQTCELLGYTRDELLQMVVTDVEIDVDLETARAAWATLPTGTRLTVRGRSRRKDGTVVPVEIWVSCVEVAGERLFMGLSHDITERERAEMALRASEARLRRLVDTNLIGIIHWDIQGRILNANDEFLRTIGYTREDLDAGRIDWTRMTPDEHRLQDARAVEELRRTGMHAPIEKEYLRKDGSRVWVLVGGAHLDERLGIGFVLDISRQKATEAALRQSEQVALDAAAFAETERGTLEAILEAAPAGIILADANGRLLRFNPANELLWGAAPHSSSVDEYHEWKGWWADQSPRRGRRVEPEEWAMSRALRGETVRNDLVEIEPFGQPGVRHTMVNSGAPVRNAAGKVIGAVIVQMDISALVAAEAARRESESRFRAVADHITQLAWMADEQGNIFWFNRRWFDYTGATLDQARDWGWTAFHHPAHLGRVVEKLRRCFQTGEPWEDTFPLRGRDGSYRWFLSRAVPIHDTATGTTRWFGTNTDVTRQRAAEEALREADRRKDEFISILAHELRNPLAPVRLGVEILRRSGSSGPAVERVRDVIDRQVTHMARLIDDLLDVSRIARGKLALRLERCDLGAIASQTAEDYRATLEASGLQLVVDYAEPVWVEGDPVRLAQMVGNLLHNSGRFTESGGRVELWAGADADQQAAIVEVRDTGVGIDEALLARLFDPFSQADQGMARAKGGLGLGLALTRGLVELHGGGIEVRSDGPGRGATFTLRLPLSSGPFQRPPVVPDVIQSPQPLRILVVEDNVDGAKTLADLLELAGHDVRLAYDGPSGVRLAREFRPDVVISDIGLPGVIDGYSVARQVRSERVGDEPYLIALSGYANDEARRRSQDAGFDIHLAKPPDVSSLERALAAVRRH